MLQRNSDSDGRKRRSLCPHHASDVKLGWRQSETFQVTQQGRPIDNSRYRCHFHFAGDVDVVCWVGFRIVLAIFRERGKARDGNEQKQDTDAKAKPPVGCDLADETWLLLLSIHARMQTTGKLRETPLSAARCLSWLLHLTVIRIQKARMGMQGCVLLANAM